MAPNHMNHNLAITDDNNDQNHLTYCSSFENYDKLSKVAADVLNVYYTNFKTDGSPDPKLRAYQHTKRAFARPGTNLNLNIPRELWNKLDDHLKKRIYVNRKEIRAKNKNRSLPNVQNRKPIG